MPTHLHQQSFGVTLIELLLAISLVAVLAASASPFLSRFVLTNNFEVSRDKLSSVVRKAQAYAMDNKNNNTWGVCLNGSDLRLFSGSCTTPITQENFTIPSSIVISGLNEVTFNSRGEPSVTMNVTISSAVNSTVISVNAVGGLEEN